MSRIGAEPVMCDGGELPVVEARTWWAEDILLSRCEGCCEPVGTYLSEGRIFTQRHLRTDLAGSRQWLNEAHPEFNQ